METGLWRKSRHPNLFFDLITWFCFALGSICDLISLCSLIGPVILFCVMEFLTTPLTEEHMKKKRGEAYEQYVSRTNKYLVM
jgi:steroid 5-alpha reductase family enzyme